jgi:sec-independent protein translocase protein TatA
MIGDIMQPTHLLFVLVVALLVLGPKRLPEVGRQLGSGLRDFRAALSGERSETHDESAGSHGEPVVPDLAADPTEAAPQHEFAEDAVSVADDHVFAHDTSETNTVGDHEFAQGAATVSDTPSSTTDPVGGHEFAYETSDPAEKQSDPPS